jgi:hypothetical protein
MWIHYHNLLSECGETEGGKSTVVDQKKEAPSLGIETQEFLMFLNKIGVEYKYISHMYFFAVCVRN